MQVLDLTLLAQSYNFADSPLRGCDKSIDLYCPERDQSIHFFGPERDPTKDVFRPGGALVRMIST